MEVRFWYDWNQIFFKKKNWSSSDIYNGNVVFRLFDLKDSSPNDPLEELGTPLKGKVRRYDGAPIEKGLPAYLVDPAAYRADFSDDIKLIDFGECMYPCKWLARQLDSRKDCST